jgi:hypothetical protein
MCILLVECNELAAWMWYSRHAGRGVLETHMYGLLEFISG